MDYKNKNIAVLGLARSGYSAAKLLINAGANVVVSDSNDTPEIRQRLDELKQLGANCELGGHSDLVYRNVEQIILSPGIPRNIPILNEALTRNPKLSIISEIELAYRFAPGRIIAITGSNGKSTTTSLVGSILDAAGLENYVVGNIGRPFSEVVLESSQDAIYSLEISSFQLETIEDFHAFVGCILNLTPDHMDRYANEDEYYQTKENVFKNQTQSDFAVFNSDEDRVYEISWLVDSRVLVFCSNYSDEIGAFRVGNRIKMRNLDMRVLDVLKTDELIITGPHNWANVCAAISCVIPLGIDKNTIKEGLITFKGLRHRLQKVRNISGVEFYNDSKATNIDSMRRALESFEKPVILIAGGYDKGADFSEILGLAGENVKNAILIGDTAQKIADSWGQIVNIEIQDSLKDAVDSSYANAQPGDIVLFSPGCASYDMFENFEQRGDKFIEIVNKLSEK